MKFFIKYAILLIFNLHFASSFLQTYTNIHKTNTLMFLTKNERFDKIRLDRDMRKNNNIKSVLAFENIKNIVNNTNIDRFSSFHNNPIQKATSNKIIMNIELIEHIYITWDYDRVVFCLSNKNRYVIHIKNDDDKKIIENIFNIVNKSVKMCIFCNKNLFTDNLGIFYSN